MNNLFVLIDGCVLDHPDGRTLGKEEKRKAMSIRTRSALLAGPHCH
jgi:hypothetical protein